MVVAGTGAAAALAAVIGAGFAGLSRLLDRSRDWRLDQRANREQL